MDVNVCKEKHLTNMRSKSSDGVTQLTPPTILSLEQALDFIENDELLEITPKSLRLRKESWIEIRGKSLCAFARHPGPYFCLAFSCGKLETPY